MSSIVYKKTQKGKKEAITGYLFITLPLIGFLFFTAISMGVSIVYSFTNFNPVRHLDFSEVDFVWFKNYIALFKDEKF